MTYNLHEVFKSRVSEEQYKTVSGLIDELSFLETQMAECKKLPFIRFNPENPSQQKKTEAAKLYKECSQSYMNGVRILAGLLNKVDTSAENELLKKLEEFY